MPSYSLPHPALHYRLFTKVLGLNIVYAWPAKWDDCRTLKWEEMDDKLLEEVKVFA